MSIYLLTHVPISVNRRSNVGRDVVLKTPPAVRRGERAERQQAAEAGVLVLRRGVEEELGAGGDALRGHVAGSRPLWPDR